MRRRSFLLSGLAAARLFADSAKGEVHSSDWGRYADPTTDLEVYRLTNPQMYASTLPAYYNRAITRNSNTLLFCSDRSGTPQAFRMDLKSGQTRQLTDARELDGASLTFTPDNRSFCFFAGPTLTVAALSSMRQREIYKIPKGWERSAGMSVGPDGTHAIFGEQRGETSRLRTVLLSQGASRTIVQAPFVLSDPIARPMRAQILYRQDDQALWLVNADGTQNRQLKLADGRIGPANWAADGKTILYLRFPEDPKQLNEIREATPDANTDKLVARTSQFVHFGFNRDSSVFVGASRNAGSPTVLLLLRVTRREFTVCEHKAAHPELVSPIFSPDSQSIYFQSDRSGKPAIYCVHVDKLVEKTSEG
jgi:Tol biopolymer transport system component